MAPSAKKAPIGWFTPKELSGRDVEATIDDFARASALAEEAGYDGVEIMGSEGYLINEFIASRTNRRTDEWGGAYSNRIKLPVRIVEEVRKAVRQRAAKDVISANLGLSHHAELSAQPSHAEGRYTQRRLIAKQLQNQLLKHITPEKTVGK